MTDMNEAEVLLAASRLAHEKGDSQFAAELLKKALEQDPLLLNHVSGDFEAEGVEQQAKRAYSVMNPFGI